MAKRVFACLTELLRCEMNGLDVVEKAILSRLQGRHVPTNPSRKGVA